MPRRMRDITAALHLAQVIEAAAGDMYSPDINHTLVAILQRLDARTGRREKGQGAALVPARKSAKARR